MQTTVGRLRGGDKLYSVNWGMLGAVHKLGRGQFYVALDAQPGARHGSAIIHTGYGSRVDEIRRAAASASSSDAQHDLSTPMWRTAKHLVGLTSFFQREHSPHVRN